ncbi:hypothetical protein D3C73_1392490 [compost metagenome]
MNTTGASDAEFAAHGLMINKAVKTATPARAKSEENMSTLCLRKTCKTISSCMYKWWNKITYYNIITYKALSFHEINVIFT